MDKQTVITKGHDQQNKTKTQECMIKQKDIISSFITSLKRKLLLFYHFKIHQNQVFKSNYKNI